MSHQTVTNRRLSNRADIAGCGGILELLQTAAMAEAHSVAVSPHNYNSATIAHAAMLQVSALLPNMLTAEVCPCHVPVGASFTLTDSHIVEVCANLAGTPGLGVKIDEGALRACCAGEPGLR